MSTVAYRPRSISEIIDASVRLARAHYPQLAALSAILYLPSILIELTLSPGPAGEASIASNTIYVTATLLSTLWYLPVTGALIYAVSEAYLGRPIEIDVSLKRGFGRAGSLIGLGIIRYMIAMVPLVPALFLSAIAFVGGASPTTILIAALLLFAGFIAAVYLYLLLVLSPPALMLEGVGIGDALGRSRTLTEGRRGSIFGLLLLVGLMVGAIIITAALLGQVISSNEVVFMALWQLGLVLLWPLVETVIVVLYYDTRIRKEGYDIELMAKELAPATAATS